MASTVAPKRALYFGCRDEPGHFLQEGRRTIYDVPAGCPWTLALMDGGLLQNGKHPDVYDGKVWWTCGGRDDLWYAFFWWDNSVDRRGACNSGFYVRGFAPEILSPQSARENARPAFEDDLARALAMKVMSGSFTERGQAARELDMMARHNTGVAKARHVAAYCKILLKSGKPIILGGWHRDVYDIWLEELKDFRPVLYTGSESVRQKDAAKNAFMAGDTDCFIMSLRSGAGLDGLQHRCADVVHGELDWSREVHKQLEGRLRPHARTDSINVHYLIADGGSDPVIAAVQGLKASQAQGIIDPKRGVQAVHSDESRIKALAQAYLDRAAKAGGSA